MEELNLEGEPDSNLQGDDSLNDSEDLSDLFQETSLDRPEDSLVRINQATGKNFKSLEDVAKSLQQADIEFAKKGQEPKEPKITKPEPVRDDELAEEVLLTRHPEAELVIEDARKIARDKGVSVLKAYRETKWLSQEAKSRAELQEEQEKSKQKINKPSAVVGDANTDFTRVNSLEDFNKLSRDDKVKFTKFKDAQEKGA